MRKYNQQCTIQDIRLEYISQSNNGIQLFFCICQFKEQDLILLRMNYSTLEPLPYTTPLKHYHIDQEWQGQRSQRFARSIRFEPHADLIKSNFEMPDQTPTRGRSHFQQPSSFQQPFRPSIHKVPQIKHWHLRQSKIRTMQFRPSEVHRRPQRVHNNMIAHNPEQRRPQSIRTFYINNWRTQRQYSVEDRMQRKTRIDPVQLKKTFYKDLNIFTRK